MYMCESSYIFTGCGEESAKWRCTQTPKEEEELEESSSSCTTTTVKGELYPPPLFFPLLNIWQGNYHQREPIYLVYTGRQGCSYISLFLSFSPLIAISLGPYSPPPSHTCCCSTKPQTRNWWRAQPTHTCESLHQQRTQVSYKEKCILYDTYNRFIFIKAHGVITFSPFVFLLCCLNRFVDCALRE
jgi:hypothetical protein